MERNKNKVPFGQVPLDGMFRVHERNGGPPSLYQKVTSTLAQDVEEDHMRKFSLGDEVELIRRRMRKAG